MIVAQTMRDDQLDEVLGLGFGGSNNAMSNALQEDMLAFMKKHLDLDAIRGDMRTFYLERFSAEELAVIADFHVTPAAQKFQALGPELMARNMGLVQTIMVEHRDEFMKIIQKHTPAGLRPPGSQR